MERKTDNITVIIVHGDNANTSACACVRNKYMAVLHVNMSVLLGNLTVLFRCPFKKIRGKRSCTQTIAFSNTSTFRDYK